MRTITICLAALALASAASASESWHPGKREKSVIVRQAKKDIRSANEPGVSGKNCSSLDIGFAFKGRNVPAGWCHTTSEGQVYFTKP